MDIMARLDAVIKLNGIYIYMYILELRNMDLSAKEEITESPAPTQNRQF